MEHTPKSASAPEHPEKPGIIPRIGWSWGAFMLHAPFLIAIKKYIFLLWYLLLLIPFLNVFFLIALMIYLGVEGHELAAQSPQFKNQDEYNGFFRAYNHAGKILFLAVIVMIAAGLLFGLAGTAFTFLGTALQFNMPASPAY